MRSFLATLGVAAALAGAAAYGASTESTVNFDAAERAAILAHGPWPPERMPDPSNRFSGNKEAISFGRQLFFDKRLSLDGQRSCATCHDPTKAFADGKARSVGLAVVDRNAIALANLSLNRWFGWSGAADSPWAQSIRPITDPKELGLTPERLQDRIAGETDLSEAYARVFKSSAASNNPERALADVAKALAAFQETIVTGRTRFDAFRDALERGDAAAVNRYPVAAQRGLKTFIGKGKCNVCHFGPNFANGEFDNVGVPHFAERGRVDTGRYGGIAALLASPFNLLGPHSDDPEQETRAIPTRHVEALHRNWGEFRVPSLRNVALTAPYMHDGSLATLRDAVRHYSELNEERLHGHEAVRLLRPLGLTDGESADLVAFLETLTGEITAGK
jgi:cytochrome c peroxidase